MQIKMEITGLMLGILAPGFVTLRMFLWYYSGKRMPVLFPGLHLGGIVFDILLAIGLGSLGYQMYNLAKGRRTLWGARISLAMVFLFLIAFTSAPVGP